MARNERESSYPTLWQIEAFRAAATADSWEDVTAHLGVDTKHQVMRTVARLGEKLGIRRGLLLDRDNAPFVPDVFRPLVDEARGIVKNWTAMQELARETERSYFIRLDGYWSHIENFAGPVIAEFETASKGSVKIELVPGFGRKRDQGGAGMVADLLPPNPRVDAVIAPDDEKHDPADITSVRLYRWALLAALDKNHPLGRDVNADGLLDVVHLSQFGLAASPKGHRTRDLLDFCQSSLRSFEIRIMSPEPAALVALGHNSRVVPVIASDSALPMGPWLGSVRRDGSTVPRWWPAIQLNGRALGGAYRLYWRTEKTPRAVVTLIEQLAVKLRDAAGPLDRRVERWESRLPTEIRE